MSAAGVNGCTSRFHREGAGSNPSAALHNLRVSPIPYRIARALIEWRHYLHSLPGGTALTFGVFLGVRLLGAVALGAGPFLGYQLVEGARSDDCLTLTRLWLADDLPANAESRVLGILIRSLKKSTSLKFLLAYSDPGAGHVGTIYQATGWIYTGLSAATPLYDIGDGVPRHSRSLAHELGTHSINFFKRQGIRVKMITQSAKHRYVYFLDPEWRPRLLAPILPYPKRGGFDAGNQPTSERA